MRLQLQARLRDLAVFNLGIDSKLRACDLVKLTVKDVRHGDRVAQRAIVMQQKSGRPVQFEITEAARASLRQWIAEAGLRGWRDRMAAIGQKRASCPRLMQQVRAVIVRTISALIGLPLCPRPASLWVQ
ncbi:MAG: hypothetical protein KA795_01800 [Burkholderiaceae bacterium]|nr:hypothetical protein [Burkholderiaceae bacterium]